ncbi:unnamed protein product [Hyaloperonospora brassicae]|uniref:Uncharacterized protein n=1 Tax=Hyaloperonospora brassicae TaxID=162125 RepID=A0AAV0T378_HYABA|nr:unnamed protein product [Hyaloperonospora brassicae]CAI5713757.1 unnamed protein product [Hyaloperonospora brassicae]CAI5713763.1 unnamed protein product [Hyaloperonospora brassicae]CAI5713778.1 unnamed protein product [Hyaloperonospora brassicae]CAI5713786.1 unnamed protein product [Hyaloperonospora brassicae]
MHVKAIFFLVSAAVVSSFDLVSAVDQECAGQPKCVGVGHDLVDKLTSDCHKFPTIVAYYKCCNDNCAKKGGKKDDKKKKESVPEGNSDSNKNANRHLRDLQA